MSGQTSVIYSRQRLTVPPAGAGRPVVVSVSGGKDSTALALALRESEIPAQYVFADTDWEDEETYAHLAELTVLFGAPIARVRAAWVNVDPEILDPDWSLGSDDLGPFLSSPFGVFRGGMVNRVLAGARFSARMQRWCTRELKLEPLRAFHDTINDGDTVCAVGIRGEESADRALMKEWEWEEERVTAGDEDRPGWGGWIWRPLLDWKVEDVLAIHHRHNVPVNPLYRRGHDRVGCYPCITSQKDELRVMADHRPERVALIEALERMVSRARKKRNAEDAAAAATARRMHDEGASENEIKQALGLRLGNAEATKTVRRMLRGEPRYEHERASFFLTVDRSEDGMMPIAQIVKWARTDRGGKQFPLLPPPPRGGCMRWGFCDAPKPKAAS